MYLNIVFGLFSTNIVQLDKLNECFVIPEDGEYMSFGISGEEDHSRMVGADVAVAWVDRATLKGYAADYFLDAKSQCAGQRGSCPDDRLAVRN